MGFWHVRYCQCKQDLDYWLYDNAYYFYEFAQTKPITKEKQSSDTSKQVANTSTTWGRDVIAGMKGLSGEVSSIRQFLRASHQSMSWLPHFLPHVQGFMLRNPMSIEPL